MWNRTPILVSAVLVCALLCAWTGNARAQSSSWDLPEFKEAAAAASRWDCKTAWDIIWPFAKRGNNEARFFLFRLVINNTNPPGYYSGLSSSFLSRHLFTLAIYGALAGIAPDGGDPSHAWARKEVPILINELALGQRGDLVAQCYKSGDALRNCLDLAISLGVAPRFEDYAEEVDNSVRQTGRGASCRYPH